MHQNQCFCFLEIETLKMTYEILNNLHCWMLMSVKLTLAVPSRDKPIYQQCLKKLKTIKHKELTILIIASYEGRNYDELLTFISSDFLTINVGFLTYFHSHVIDEQFPISSVSYSNTPTILLRLDNFPPSDDIWRYIAPLKLTFPGPVSLPTP